MVLSPPSLHQVWDSAADEPLQAAPADRASRLHTEVRIWAAELAHDKAHDKSGIDEYV